MSTVSSSRILPNKYKEDATSSALTTRIPNANKFAVNVYSTDFSTSTEKFSVDKDKTLIDTVQLTNPLGIASGGTGLSSVGLGYGLLQGNSAGTAYAVSYLRMIQGTFPTAFYFKNSGSLGTTNLFTFFNDVITPVPDGHNNLHIYSSSYYTAIPVQKNGVNGWNIKVYYDLTIDQYFNRSTPSDNDYLFINLPCTFDEVLPRGVVVQVRDWNGAVGEQRFIFNAYPGSPYLTYPWDYGSGDINGTFFNYGFAMSQYDRWICTIDYFTLQTPP